MQVSKQVWVIMDKARRVIACGVPRSRHLALVENALNYRVLTYATEGKARAGFKVSQFYLGEAEAYMNATYGQPQIAPHSGRTYIAVNQRKRCEEIYEAVEITMSIDVPWVSGLTNPS